MFKTLRSVYDKTTYKVFLSWDGEPNEQREITGIGGIMTLRCAINAAKNQLRFEGHNSFCVIERANGDFLTTVYKDVAHI